MDSAEWHTKTTEEVLESLQGSKKGLSERDARKRLAEVGPNELVERRRVTPALIFLHQFKSSLVLILLVAIAISLLIGRVNDALIILAIVIANAILGFIQEYRAEEAMRALRKLIVPRAKVIRDGKEKLISAKGLVPGDIILLEEGDQIPADARLIESISLKVDESSLTGESVPVAKEECVLEEAALAERKNMAFMGTTATYGRAKAVVVSTAMNTEIGKIAELVQVEERPTPLQIKLSQFAKWLGLFILFISAIVFLIGIVEGKEIFTMFLTAIALAVAAVPEGLPAVVTVTLAIGVQRMAKRNAVIRKLPAVEALGSTTVICSDKTGTMTTNEMTVRKIYCNERLFNVTGVGFEPEGKFYKGKRKIDAVKNEHLALLARIAALCNNAVLTKDEKWHIIGDPTEGALAVLAAKAGVWQRKDEFERVAELPFTSERKRMSTVYSTAEGVEAYVKGAPETVLELCNRVYKARRTKPLGKRERENIVQITEEMAADGLRVLALAYRKLASKDFRQRSVERDLVFVGLVGMIDPPREETKRAIRLCRQAGIKVVMVTGDHKATAMAVAKEIGLLGDGRIITGDELDELSDGEFREIVQDVAVYTRVTPQHKVRIVDALKIFGHVVAVTGDGVNDAPALKGADVGVAMGIKGTDVAKQASDMVLVDDNFATVVNAVEEGRSIYDNIRKFVRFLLSANFDEIAVISLAALAGLPLPFLPMHILWINLITDGLPALALSVDPKEPDIMKRPPRSPRKGILSGMLFFIMAAASLACLSSFGLFVWELHATGSVAKARTMAVTVAIFFELFFVFNCRSEKRSAFRASPLSNKYLIAAVALSVLAQLAVIYVPFLQPLFGTVALGAMDLAKVVLISASALVLSPRIFLA